MFTKTTHTNMDYTCLQRSISCDGLKQKNNTYTCW